MAENPATWGPVERVINDALNRADVARARKVIGGTRAMQIANALRKAGLLSPLVAPMLTIGGITPEQATALAVELRHRPEYGMATFAIGNEGGTHADPAGGDTSQ